jgi:hypothetical protein
MERKGVQLEWLGSFPASHSSLPLAIRYLEVQAREEIYENPDGILPRRRSFFAAVRTLLQSLQRRRQPQR